MGVEPTTYPLRVDCSTTELGRLINAKMNKYVNARNIIPIYTLFARHFSHFRIIPSALLQQAHHAAVPPGQWLNIYSQDRRGAGK